MAGIFYFKGPCILLCMPLDIIYIYNPRNAKYTHHDIQNEILDIMANMIRDQISGEIQDAELFALMVDESKDLSKTEQVSVVVRYVKNDEVVEEFLHFTPADGLDAESLFAIIKETLSKCNIDHTACIAQCYDGAAVMSGVHNGVQEKFREEVPQAIYIHCHAHRLNLVLVDCVRNVKPAGDFFCYCARHVQVFLRLICPCPFH